MKKTVMILAAVVLMMGLMPVTAFAHGHSGRSSATAKHSLCGVENCNTAGNHKHGRTTYSGHYLGDGHSYHHSEHDGKGQHH